MKKILTFPLYVIYGFLGLISGVVIVLLLVFKDMISFIENFGSDDKEEETEYYDYSCDDY